MVPIKLRLGDPHGLLEVLVGQLWIDDHVAVVLKVGRLHTARNRLPAVEQK